MKVSIITKTHVTISLMKLSTFNLLIGANAPSTYVTLCNISLYIAGNTRSPTNDRIIVPVEKAQVTAAAVVKRLLPNTKDFKSFAKLIFGTSMPNIYDYERNLSFSNIFRSALLSFINGSSLYDPFIRAVTAFSESHPLS